MSLFVGLERNAINFIHNWKFVWKRFKEHLLIYHFTQSWIIWQKYAKMSYRTLNVRLNIHYRICNMQNINMNFAHTNEFCLLVISASH